MTADELTKRLKAGETVTLYHQQYTEDGLIKIGKRVLFIDPHDPNRYHIKYTTGSISTFLFEGNLLRHICKYGETQWWLAWGRALREQTQNV